METLYLVLTENFYISFKQMAAFSLVILIDIIIYLKFIQAGKIFMIFFFLLSVCDVIRYTVQTVVTESAFHSNDSKFAVLFQPQALIWLIIFLFLNYDLFIKGKKPM